jgi:hypothetical protein
MTKIKDFTARLKARPFKTSQSPDFFRPRRRVKLCPLKTD